MPRSLFLALSVLPAAALAQATAPSFTPLGFLPGGGFSQAAAISADGSTITGFSGSTPGTQAFRYDRATGAIAALGTLPGGDFSSGLGISANGAVVVGFASAADGIQGFRSEGGAISGLGDLPDGVFDSSASGVSGDGTVVVGRGTNADNFSEAFRYTATGGLVGLGDLPGGGFDSTASAISRDGQVIVGRGTNADENAEAFRYVNGVMTGLGDLPGGGFLSNALAVSADGSVVVGLSFSGNFEGFRWENGVMTGLGTLPGFDSRALAVSPDGRVTVGDASRFNNVTSQFEERAFIHDEVNGLVDLNVLLTARGVLPAGWVLNQATGVTVDATGVPIVTGFGTFQGRTQAFVAAVPEPASMLALGLGGLALLRRRRK